MTRNPAVYAQTNDAAANEVLAFARDANGTGVPETVARLAAS